MMAIVNVVELYVQLLQVVFLKQVAIVTAIVNVVELYVQLLQVGCLKRVLFCDGYCDDYCECS